MRQLGSDIAEYLEKQATEYQLDGSGMLTLLLTIAHGWAARAGLDPRKSPRPLFEYAARIWDAVSSTQRIDIVSELPHNGRRT